MKPETNLHWQGVMELFRKVDTRKGLFAIEKYMILNV